MILSVQISNHPANVYFTRYTCLPAPRSPASVRVPICRSSSRARTKTTSRFAGSLTAHSLMLAPAAGSSRHVELNADPTRFDIQPCSTQGTGYVCKGRSRRGSKKSLVYKRLVRTSVAEFLVVKHEPAVR